MKTITALTLTAVLMFFTGCAQTYRTSDDGKTAQVNVGKTFEVQLDGNPTTGYQWQLVKIDETLVEQVGTAQYEPKSNLIGASGTDTFTFKAIKASQSTLQFTYSRPWEKDVKPAQTYTLMIDAK